MEHSGQQILAHLKDLVRTVMDGEAGPKKSFLALAGDMRFSGPEIKLLFLHASKTAQTELNGTHAGLWPLYRDNLIKKTMWAETLPPELLHENLMDIVIFSRWNKEKFQTIMKLPSPQTTPDYPAAMGAVDGFPVLLFYMADKVSPVIEKHLCESMGINGEELARKLSDREATLVQDGVGGVEILMPIPPQKWPRTRKSGQAPEQG